MVPPAGTAGATGLPRHGAVCSTTPRGKWVKGLVASAIWLLYAVFWCFISVDWQRVRHVFELDMLDEAYKIVDCSLVKEQELLQTSAVFLFSAGLVANFLSGAPWEVTTVRAISQWVNTPGYQNYTKAYGIHATTPGLVWRHGTTSATAFRGLWGTCMLFTLFAVICSYVSRTALFLTWNLIRMKLETIRKAAKAEATERVDAAAEAAGIVDPAWKAASIKATVDVAVASEYKLATAKAGTPFKTLTRLERYVAWAVSASKLMFIVSLLLWLATIIYAIVDLHRLRTDTHSNHDRTAGGAVLVGIAGTITILAIVAFVRLLANCWTAYQLWTPDVSHGVFVGKCHEQGIWTTCRTEPLVERGNDMNVPALELAGAAAVRGLTPQNGSLASSDRSALAAVFGLDTNSCRRSHDGRRDQDPTAAGPNGVALELAQVGRQVSYLK